MEGGDGGFVYTGNKVNYLLEKKNYTYGVK